MPCYHPIPAYRAPGGGVAFSPKKGYVDRPVELPCGKCFGCRSSRAKDWSLRIAHEAELHEKNCFITLTYDQDHLPADLSVDVKHWQLFAKKLRKAKGPFRFLHCGEYGDTSQRPHYHACIMGHDFREDRQPWKQNPSGTLYVSPELEGLWGRGFATIGELTRESAAYVARYVMKKSTHHTDNEQYRRLDIETGEEWYVKPEYITMSRRPGLGRKWLDEYQSEVYPSDQVVMDGKINKPPKFYDRVLAETPTGEELLAEMKELRKKLVKPMDQTPERRRIRETVARAAANKSREN